jgi:nucleoid-associated protein YgaU
MSGGDNNAGKAKDDGKAFLLIEDGTKLPCIFNPKDFSVTKSNSWSTKEVPSQSAVTPTFGGGQPQELTLALLFDATLLTPKMSVTQVTVALFKSMKASKKEPGKSKLRPPTLKFEWGAFSFLGVTKSLTVQYQLFRENGEPIRADVKLTLMQWDVLGAAWKGQNPTTRSAGGLGAHIVRDGDSLPSIAYRLYGDPTLWRPIAEANGIDDPLSLRSGLTLSVPSLDA